MQQLLKEYIFHKKKQIIFWERNQQKIRVKITLHTITAMSNNTIFLEWSLQSAESQSLRQLDTIIAMIFDQRTD